MRITLEGDDRQTLIARLGLSEDASNADIQAAVTARILAEQSPPAPDPDPDPTPDPDPSPDDDPDDDDPDDVEAGSTVRVDVEAFRALTTRASQADQLEEDERKRKRDDLISAAIRKGKFGPSRRKHYAARYDSDPEGTTREIERMAENVVPVSERGKDVSEEDLQASDAYDLSMLSPQERERIERARSGGSPTANGSAQQTPQSRVHVED